MTPRVSFLGNLYSPSHYLLVNNESCGKIKGIDVFPVKSYPIITKPLYYSSKFEFQMF